MIVAKKIRLLPTKEQEILFFKSAGTARWAYNFFLEQTEKYYNENKKPLKEGDVRKLITALKKDSHKWLGEVSANVPKQAVKDGDTARHNWLTGKCGKPEYKSRHKSKLSFYVNYESLTKTDIGFQGEKIGEIKTVEPLPKIKRGKKYSNPRISYDGKNWFLSVGYEIKQKKVPLTNVSLGIDLGIKDLAICSDGAVYKNINKTKEVRRLKKKLRREQRKLSRKLLANTESYTSKRKPIYKTALKDMKNIQKQNKKIRSIYKKLTDIRNNYRGIWMNRGRDR